MIAGQLLLREGGWLGVAGAVCTFALTVVLLRGCPMCWVVGLVETLAARIPHDPARAMSREGEQP